MCVCVYVHTFLIAHVEGVGICGNLKEIQILSDQVGGVKNNLYFLLTYSGGETANWVEYSV